MTVHREPDPSRRSAGLLAFVFGVAETPSLPGPVLVQLLTDLGVGPSAVRSLLARLRASGDLTTHREGRVTTYTMAGAMRAAWSRSDSAARGRRGTAWSGDLHGILWSVPESHRGFRDQLRRITRLAGYAPLHPGLFVNVEDQWDVVAAHMSDVPDGARVCPLLLRMSPADAAAAARDAWNLDGLAARYRTLIAHLRAGIDQEVEPGPSALRQFEHLTSPVYQALIVDPGLPDDLLPPDWPMPELLAALHATITHHQGEVERYVDHVRATAGGARMR